MSKLPHLNEYRFHLILFLTIRNRITSVAILPKLFLIRMEASSTDTSAVHDMDDPDWTWPAWKFDMKREDLFTKLHDQYNTYSSTIQDPEAFHHDIYEICHEANSVAEFHRLAGDRKHQRLSELDKALENASFEIIANPCLVSKNQWQHAVQVFRAHSFDSVVR